MNTWHDYSRARKFNEANTQDSAVIMGMSVAMSQMACGQHTDLPFAWHLGYLYTGHIYSWIQKVGLPSG